MRDRSSYVEAGRLGALAANRTKQKKRRQILKAYKSNPSRCTMCTAALSYSKRKNRFCSRSCAAKHNNLGRRRHGFREHDACLFCGASLVGTKSKKYCNRTCQHTHQWQQKKAHVLANPDEPVRPSITRRILLEDREAKCESCGRKTWKGQPIPLEQDHIDGNHMNNSMTNLRLLCPNCHALTPTYCIRNLGNGRAYRRHQYAKFRRSLTASETDDVD